jgi:hypothetical protein
LNRRKADSIPSFSPNTTCAIFITPGMGGYFASSKGKNIPAELSY